MPAAQKVSAAILLLLLLLLSAYVLQFSFLWLRRVCCLPLPLSCGNFRFQFQQLHWVAYPPPTPLAASSSTLRATLLSFPPSHFLHSASCDDRCQHERLVTNIPRLLLLLLSPHTDVVVVAYLVVGTDADAGAGAEAAAY